MIESTDGPSDEDRLRLLAHRLLHDLEEAFRGTLIESFRVAEVGSGTPILKEGHTNARLYVLLKGEVAVELPKREQRPSEVRLATLGAGDILGEYSLFDRHPVSATVFATAPTRVAWIEKAELDAFVNAHPESGRRFYDGLVRLLIARLRAKDAELDVFTIG